MATMLDATNISNNLQQNREIGQYLQEPQFFFNSSKILKLWIVSGVKYNQFSKIKSNVN